MSMQTKALATARPTRAGSGGIHIKTPDQRLRVFISSTLQELADERAAARRAVERLHFAPVMFELGARPHAPRTLYRAYLDQSHVFIGIYWQSYGWVAPEMDISGLDDEYALSGDKPKLIYIKHPAPDRDDRLADLVTRIGGEGVSYKRFSDADELERLIGDDLALLLTERFEVAAPTEKQKKVSTIPALVNRFVGRAAEMDALKHLLGAEARLVTVTGPGGIGKSRLALEFATEMKEHYTDGAHLILLQSVRDPALVASTIAHTLQVEEAGSSPLEALIAHLKHKNMLLVLDNFEQVVSASNVIVGILTECPRVAVLVTTRQVLNVRGEWELPLAPLEAPPATETAVERLHEFDSVQLFVDRARSVTPDLAVDESNAAVIGEIVRRLEGLPLAIELAAAWARILSPDAMLTRLEDRFKLLKGGGRDFPERHQTLRSTIDWSFDLLSEDEQALFARLAVFNGGCTLEAIELICTPNAELDALDGLASLIDKSLLRRPSGESEPRYSMLETIHEYAYERLRERDELDELCSLHADHYFELILGAGAGMRGPTQTESMERLDAEIGNVRSAMGYFLRAEKSHQAAATGWTLWQYWWLRDHLEEGRRWMKEVLSQDLNDEDRAKALAVEGIMAFWQGSYGECVPAVSEALALFEKLDHDTGVALCQLPLGFVESVLGNAEDALARFKRSCQIFDDAGDRWGSAIARIGLCWLWVGAGIEIDPQTFAEGFDRAKLLGTRAELGMALGNRAAWELRRGNLAQARSDVAACLDLLYKSKIRGPSTYSIDVVAELAMREGDLARAARFFGAADGIRMAINAPLAPIHAAMRERLLGEAKEGLGATRFDECYGEGQAISYPDAMVEALEWCASE